MSNAVRKISIGSVSATEWETEYDGKIKKSYSFQKSFKDKEGEWKNSFYFGVGDMPALLEVVRKITDKAAVITEMKITKEPAAPEGDGIPF